MKVLLDECLPVDFRLLLAGHDVNTVVYVGWAGVKNGRLLALAAAQGFEVMVTTDAGTEHQQNPATLPLAIVILHAPSNQLPDLTPLAPPPLAVLPSLSRGAVIHVPRPRPQLRT